MGILKGRIKHLLNLLIRKMLLVSVVILSRKYPYPTDVWHPNARILLDILDTFRECDIRAERAVLFDAIFRIVIDEYQRHIFYRGRMDVVVEKLRQSNWLSRSTEAIPYWKAEKVQAVPIGDIWGKIPTLDLLTALGEKRIK